MNLNHIHNSMCNISLEQTAGWISTTARHLYFC